MRPEEIAALPAVPASVGEWEDLLVRLEIVPRVVRNSIEEVTDVATAAAALAAAVTRERSVGAWLEAAAGIALESRRHGDEASAAATTDLYHLALRFASLRARTFAMVQRRGLEVWGWEHPLHDPSAGAEATARGSATAHQLLLALARSDGALLAALREATRARQAAC